MRLFILPLDDITVLSVWHSPYLNLAANTQRCQYLCHGCWPAGIAASDLKIHEQRILPDKLFWGHNLTSLSLPINSTRLYSLIPAGDVNKLTSLQHKLLSIDDATRITLGGGGDQHVDANLVNTPVG